MSRSLDSLPAHARARRSPDPEAPAPAEQTEADLPTREHGLRLLEEIDERLRAIEGDAGPAPLLTPGFFWNQVAGRGPNDPDAAIPQFGEIVIHAAPAAVAAVQAQAFAALLPELETRTKDVARAIEAAEVLPRLRQLAGQLVETRAALDAAEQAARQAQALAQAALAAGEDPSPGERSGRDARDNVEVLGARLTTLRKLHTQAREAARRAIGRAVDAAVLGASSAAAEDLDRGWKELTRATSGPLTAIVAAETTRNEIQRGPWRSALISGFEADLLGEAEPAGTSAADNRRPPAA